MILLVSLILFTHAGRWRRRRWIISKHGRI